MSTSARLSRPDLQQDIEAEPQTGAASLLAPTRRILGMIVAGASLTDILTNVCATIDDQNPDMMSMVMLMDPDGQRLWPVAAPRVPEEFVKAISPLMIGENVENQSPPYRQVLLSRTLTGGQLPRGRLHR